MLGKKIKVVIGNETDKGIESAETEKVAGEAVLNVVKLDNETPRVGDTITATAYDSDGNDISDKVSWQWYRTNQGTGFQNMISNATKQSYTISSMDTMGTVYAWATDNYGKTLQSSEAEPVDATKITEITVENISGKQTFSKINDVPIEGDTLAVTMNAPGAEKTATYQWKRGGSKISGATNSEYTLTDMDTETVISCDIELNAASGYEFEDSTDHSLTSNGALVQAAMNGGGKTKVNVAVTETCHDISDAELKLDPVAATTGETINASLRYDVNGDGDTEDLGDWLDENYVTYAWYIDEVSASGFLDNGTAYEVKNQDAGHKIICVVNGLGTDTAIAAAANAGLGAWYYGKVVASTDTITKKLKNVTLDASEVVGNASDNIAVILDDDNDGKVEAGDTPTVQANGGLLGTQIKATVKDGANQTVSSGIHATWTRIKDGTSTKINNVTGLSYSLTSTDAQIIAMNDGASKATTSVQYKVSITADGYSGSVDATVDILTGAPTNTNLTAAALDKKATITQVKVKDSDGTELTDDTGANLAAEGEKLSVSTVPSAAAANVDWTWAIGDGEIEDTATGTSFTVPAGSNGKFLSIGGSLNASAVTKWDATGLAGLVAALPYGCADGATPVGATDLVTTGTNATGILRSLGGLTVKYNTKADGSGTELTKPEVGGFMIIAPTHNPGVDYTFSYTTSRAYKGDNAAGGTDDDLEYTSTANSFEITEGAVGQKIKVVVKPVAGATNYKREFDVSYTSDVVVPSSRTIKEFKVLGYTNGARGANTGATWYNDDNADAYKSGQQVKNLSNAGHYAIVALDSNGDLVTLGAEAVLLDNDNQLVHTTFVPTNTAGKGGYLVISDTVGFSDLSINAGQKITVQVVPDGVNYVGEKLEYEFSTYVSA